MVLEDGDETQFPRAYIYVAGGTSPLVTLDLVHKHLGRYEANYTPASAGVYAATFIVYSDAGHTIESIRYSREAEQIFVSDNGMDDLATRLIRILGLVHENAFIDNTVFDAFSQLVAARVRIFNSAANCDLATDGGSEVTGLIATYEITSIYEVAGRMGTYKMKKV
jgi:hypothetical protein